MIGFQTYCYGNFIFNGLIVSFFIKIRFANPTLWK